MTGDDPILDEGGVDDGIRSLMAALAHSAPEPPPLPGIRRADQPSPAPVHHRPRWLAVAAVLLAALGGVTWWIGGDRDAEQPVATGAVTVIHQRVRWTQETNLACEGGTGAGTASAESEIWVDLEGGRLRERMSYADGSVRDRVLEGWWERPKRIYERGSSPYAPPECPLWGPLSFPDTGAVVVWFPRPAPGETKDPSLTVVPGTNVDALGRPVELRRREDVGTASPNQPDQQVSPEPVAVHQVLEQYWDPVTGRLLQTTYAQELEGVYRLTSTTVKVADEDIPVDPAVFATDSYQLVDEAPPPDGRHVTAEPVEPTVVVGADRYWPPDPTPGQPEETARRFAVEVLGWSDPGVSGAPDSAVNGPQLIMVDDRRGHSVELLLVPTAPGGWELLQINSGGANVGYDPEGNDQLDLPFPEGTAEVVIEAHLDPGGSQAWRATISESTAGVVLPETAGDPMVRLIVLYHDADGHTIGADTLTFGRLADPTTPPTEPTPSS